MLASKDDQSIFSKDSAPKGFRLNDPDHLTIFQIDALYHHLLVRQRQGLQPFVILNAGPLHARSTKKSEKAKGKQRAEQTYVDADDNDVSERESDLESNGMPVDDDEEADDEDRELGSGSGSGGGSDEGKSDSDSGSDVESERRSTKFGPPIGKGVRAAPSRKPIQNQNSIAGPSKPTPQKKKDAKPAKPGKAKKASMLATRKVCC